MVTTLMEAPFGSAPKSNALQTIMNFTSEDQMA